MAYYIYYFGITSLLSGAAGSNVIGTTVGALGVAPNWYNVIAKYNNGTLQTADYVDLGVSTSLFIAGLYVKFEKYPATAASIIGAGIGYGIYRISNGN